MYFNPYESPNAKSDSTQANKRPKSHLKTPSYAVGLGLMAMAVVGIANLVTFAARLGSLPVFHMVIHAVAVIVAFAVSLVVMLRRNEF